MKHIAPTPGHYYAVGSTTHTYELLAVVHAKSMGKYRRRPFVVYHSNTQWYPMCEPLRVARTFIDFSRPIAQP